MTVSDFVQRNAVSKSRIPLFGFENAIKLIELCEFEGKRILGIDTFLIYTNGSIQPILEESIDFSMTTKNDSGNWKEAKWFIASKMQKNYYFEIIYT